jgi:hypothetical protein
MYLSGSGANDPRWLDKIIQYPPTSVSTLESWVGPLAIDFAGDEGRGHVVRGRGSVRDEITRLVATFRFDMYHEDARRPRDMTLSELELALDVGHATVAQLLERRHGAGREVAGTHEYGRWFYLKLAHDGSAHLRYTVERPEWAKSPVRLDARDQLLTTLHASLAVEQTLEAINAAIEPLAADAGVEIRTWNRGQLDLSFRAGVPLPLFLQVFGWDRAACSSGDVHMTSWQVYPLRPPAEHRAPHIGPWYVDARLDDRPRESPMLGYAGPSAQYDVRESQRTVVAISIQRPR